MKLTLINRLHENVLPATSCYKAPQQRRMSVQQLGPAVTKQLRQLPNHHLKATAYAISSTSADHEADRAVNVSSRIRGAVDTITLPLDYYR
jgi:hypothetical protein